PYLEEDPPGPRLAGALEQVGEELRADPAAGVLGRHPDGHDLGVLGERDPGVADDEAVLLRGDVVPVRQRQLGEVDAARPGGAAEELGLELEHPVEVLLPQGPQGHEARLRAVAGWTSGRLR